MLFSVAERLSVCHHAYDEQRIVVVGGEIEGCHSGFVNSHSEWSAFCPDHFFRLWVYDVHAYSSLNILVSGVEDSCRKLCLVASA